MFEILHSYFASLLHLMDILLSLKHQKFPFCQFRRLVSKNFLTNIRRVYSFQKLYCWLIFMVPLVKYETPIKQTSLRNTDVEQWTIIQPYSQYFCVEFCSLLTNKFYNPCLTLISNNLINFTIPTLLVYQMI